MRWSATNGTNSNDRVRERGVRGVRYVGVDVDLHLMLGREHDGRAGMIKMCACEAPDVRPHNGTDTLNNMTLVSTQGKGNRHPTIPSLPIHTPIPIPLVPFRCPCLTQHTRLLSNIFLFSKPFFSSLFSESHSLSEPLILVPC